MVKDSNGDLQRLLRSEGTCVCVGVGVGWWGDGGNGISNTEMHKR